MEKLEQITETLESRDDVILSLKKEGYNEECFPKRYGIPMEVSLIVCPKDGLYEVEQLQQFMVQLIPGVQPYALENFYERKAWPGKKKFIYFGALFFQEEIARRKVTKEVKISGSILERMLKVDGKGQDGEEIISKDRIEIKENPIHQEIKLYVFPNQEFAKHFNHPSLYNALNVQWRRMPKKMVNKHFPKTLLQRLLSR